MGTCGIAAGAREVMKAVLDELAVRHLTDVQVQQTGCIGMCEKKCWWMLCGLENRALPTAK